MIYLKFTGRTNMKKNILFVFTFSLISLIISSCASGTALVTGTQHPATSPESVILYTEPPANYEVIGIVTASSDSEWTDQGSLDYTLTELKKQAAKIGANGILLEDVTQTTTGGVYSYGMYVPSTSQNLSGKAIYVPEE